MSQKQKAWGVVVLWVIFIYGSIPLVRSVCEALRQVTPFNLLINCIIGGLIAFYLFAILKNYQVDGRTYIFLSIAILAYTYGIIVIKIPEERIHFVQYGVLALLINHALRLDFKGYLVYVWVAIATGLLGWLDEGIQHITPGRYYDNRDVILNSISGLLGIYLDFIVRRLKRR